MDAIKWLENWFKSNCDGDWEHENPLSIYSTSNPGWSIKIYLNYTPLESLDVDCPLIENSEEDWYFYSIKNGVFAAAGDLTKLVFLLEVFKGIVEGNSKY